MSDTFSRGVSRTTRQSVLYSRDEETMKKFKATLSEQEKKKLKDAIKHANERTDQAKSSEKSSASTSTVQEKSSAFNTRIQSSKTQR